ncbi:unnamed protein product [Pleuronectes platessa]|uniref:Uncharacterized protein n=1 Tax=Pleuronectes platessa TaxID=8262 RepID=A0A9N7U6G1_PLEPL|nr:unnamed protein product [Pleuronectes platessa]
MIQVAREPLGSPRRSWRKLLGKRTPLVALVRTQLPRTAGGGPILRRSCELYSQGGGQSGPLSSAAAEIDLTIDSFLLTAGSLEHESLREEPSNPQRPAAGAALHIHHQPPPPPPCLHHGTFQLINSRYSVVAISLGPAPSQRGLISGVDRPSSLVTTRATARTLTQQLRRSEKAWWADSCSRHLRHSPAALELVCFCGASR